MTEIEKLSREDLHDARMQMGLKRVDFGTVERTLVAGTSEAGGVGGSYIFYPGVVVKVIDNQEKFLAAHTRLALLQRADPRFKDFWPEVKGFVGIETTGSDLVAVPYQVGCERTVSSVGIVLERLDTDGWILGRELYSYAAREQTLDQIRSGEASVEAFRREVRNVLIGVKMQMESVALLAQRGLWHIDIKRAISVKYDNGNLARLKLLDCDQISPLDLPREQLEYAALRAFLADNWNGIAPREVLLSQEDFYQIPELGLLRFVLLRIEEYGMDAQTKRELGINTKLSHLIDLCDLALDRLESQDIPLKFQVSAKDYAARKKEIAEINEEADRRALKIDYVADRIKVQNEERALDELYGFPRTEYDFNPILLRSHCESPDFINTFLRNDTPQELRDFGTVLLVFSQDNPNHENYYNCNPGGITQGRNLFEDLFLYFAPGENYREGNLENIRQFIRNIIEAGLMIPEPLRDFALEQNLIPADYQFEPEQQAEDQPDEELEPAPAEEATEQELEIEEEVHTQAATLEEERSEANLMTQAVDNTIEALGDNLPEGIDRQTMIIILTEYLDGILGSGFEEDDYLTFQNIFSSLAPEEAERIWNSTIQAIRSQLDIPERQDREDQTWPRQQLSDFEIQCIRKFTNRRPYSSFEYNSEEFYNTEAVRNEEVDYFETLNGSVSDWDQIDTSLLSIASGGSLIEERQEAALRFLHDNEVRDKLEHLYEIYEQDPDSSQAYYALRDFQVQVIFMAIYYKKREG